MKNIILILLPLLMFLTGCTSTAINTNPMTENYDAVITAPVEEKRVNSGEVFYIFGSNTLTAGGSDYFMGCTQNNSVYFIDFSLSMELAPIYIQFSELPTYSNNGTLLNPINMNRQLEHINSTLLVYANPTITDEGDVLFLKANFGDKKDGADFKDISKWKLKANSCYLFKITNGATSTSEYFANFFWHED